LLLCSFSFAQQNFKDGYLINAQKDTIRGQVLSRSNAKNYISCIFKGAEGEKEYFPKDILGFGYTNDKFFSSQIVPNAFVEVLVQGKLSLYKSEENSYYVQKDTILKQLEAKKIEVVTNGRTSLKDDPTWKGFINYLISDCEDLSGSRINNVKFQEASLVKIVTEYNRCKDSEMVVYKSQKPFLLFNYGISIGVTQTTLNNRDDIGRFDYLKERYSSTDPTIGLVMDLTFPRVTERVSFLTEVYFTKADFFSSLTVTEGATTNFYDTSISLSTLSIPLSFKYAFPSETLGWYAQVGMNFDYHLKASSVYSQETLVGSVVSTVEDRPAFSVDDSQLGLVFGIGLEKSFNKFKAGLGLRYIIIKQLINSPGLFTNSRRLSLNLAITTL